MQRRDKTIDPNSFARRHIGPNEEEVRVMLREVGFEDLDSLVEAAVPRNIRLDRDLNLPEAKSEMEALTELRAISRKNKLPRSFIGCGYSDSITPPVIQRNILENPGWYTAYTPYQAELAQGRLEALLNFQTMITDLTALEIANASLLDEVKAGGEQDRRSKIQNRIKPGKIGDREHSQSSFFASATRRSRLWASSVP